MGGVGVMDELKIDDRLDVTIKGARLMYTVPDNSEASRSGRLTQVSYGGTLYVLIADEVTIAKVDDDAPAETTTAPAETRVSDGRVQEILDELNGFVDRAHDGTDFNLDKALAWAAERPDVVDVRDNDDGEAEVELADGTVIEWEPDRMQWAVTVSDDTESEVAR